MSKYIRVAKDIAIVAVLVIALWSAFFGHWDVGAFYMALASFLVLVRREDDV
jgi:hypothetical protein